MLRLVAFMACALFAGSSFAQTAEPKTDDDKTLYALGVKMSEMLGFFDLSNDELKFVVQGLQDGVQGKAKADLQIFETKINEMARTRIERKNKNYLVEAEKLPGAQKMPSGLIFISEKEGTGANPTATSKVKVHYHGTLVDGTVFDSSVERGEPISFPLNGVIPCWTEGVQKIKVGGKAKLICPSSIAYGDRGAPPKIMPGATLIFDVELLGIEE